MIRSTAAVLSLLLAACVARTQPEERPASQSEALTPSTDCTTAEVDTHWSGREPEPVYQGSCPTSEPYAYLCILGFYPSSLAPGSFVSSPVDPAIVCSADPVCVRTDSMTSRCPAGLNAWTCATQFTASGGVLLPPPAAGCSPILGAYCCP